MRKQSKQPFGYTLIELMMVITIITLLASIFMPRFGYLTQKAYQSKAKGNLGSIRSALALYYSEQEGVWPFKGYPPGLTHYTSDGLSFSRILVPKYMSSIPVPKLNDNMSTFNGLSGTYDQSAINHMALTPPNDVYIILGPQDYTPLLDSPYAYDNLTGVVYYPNGNYDSYGHYFYEW